MNFVYEKFELYNFIFRSSRVVDCDTHYIPCDEFFPKSIKRVSTKFSMYIFLKHCELWDHFAISGSEIS